MTGVDLETVVVPGDIVVIVESSQDPPSSFPFVDDEDDDDGAALSSTPLVRRRPNGVASTDGAAALSLETPPRCGNAAPRPPAMELASNATQCPRRSFFSVISTLFRLIL